ncbi:hypothetical protein IQ07DRAFT_548245 [Pyrenochaeta sp. DS3sAY3a]|nr:hypothetical protein IQ07DRAFT_548245 [Pyrenochaeta sp. DS3sAY3a]
MVENENRSRHPRFCTIPFARNEGFVGRKDLLEALETECRVPGSRIALVGVGGTGKTRTALEYCYRVLDTSPLTSVFWVNASSFATFVEGFQAIADAVDLPQRHESKATMLRFVHEWLRRWCSTLWLLVLDNMDDENGLKEHLPHYGRGCVLVTSRSKTLTAVHKIIQADPMSPEDRTQLFRAITQRDNEKEFVLDVADTLGRLPLALAQAAYFMKLSAKRFWKEIEEYRTEHTNELGSTATLSAHIEATLLSIQHTSQSALDLLMLMSLCDPDGISEVQLIQLFRIIVTENDQMLLGEQELQSNLALLQQHALISRYQPAVPTYTMHPMVQAILHKRMNDSGQFDRFNQMFQFDQFDHKFTPQMNRSTGIYGKEEESGPPSDAQAVPLPEASVSDILPAHEHSTSSEANNLTPPGHNATNNGDMVGSSIPKSLSENGSTTYTAISGGRSSALDESSHSVGIGYSTIPTSSGATKPEALAEKGLLEVDQDDAGTTFSYDSVADNMESEYLLAFVQTLAQDIESATGMTKLSNLPFSYISETLRAFSWRLHEESSNPFQWGASIALYKKREFIIATLTGQTNTADNDRESMSEDDETGEVSPEPLPFVKPKEMLFDWIQNVSISTDDVDAVQYPKDNDLFLLNLSEYERFIRDSEAYRWLVAKIGQHERLIFPGHDAMSNIGLVVRDELRTCKSLHTMSGRRPLARVMMQFDLEWHPGHYLDYQCISELPYISLDFILCITGSWGEAQAMTVSQYMRQTWPVTCESMLSLFNEMLKFPRTKKNEYQVQDKKAQQLSAHLKTPRTCVISVTAGSYYISEVAEQIAWLVATLQPSSQNECTKAHFPRLERFLLQTAVDDLTAEVNASCTFSFERDDDPKRYGTNGLCWNPLFNKITFVTGYPTLRRPQPNSGLEISLHILAYLIRSDQIVQYGKRLMMKGFEFLLVATQVMSDAAFWHLSTSGSPGERISYFEDSHDAMQVVQSNGSSLRTLENMRHIVGWCANAEDMCGHKTASRMISASELPNIPSSIVIDRLYLEGGMHTIVGLNMRINQKEDPIRLLRDQDYPSLLKWIAAQPITFFDVGPSDRRAWLIDGASALLHLVRISLHRDETDDESTFEWVFDSSKLKDDWPGCAGRLAAINTLKNSQNLNLNLYVEKMVGSVIQYSTLRERVTKILHTLEVLIDVQAKEMDKGEIRTLQTLDRRKNVTGFDILDVVEPLGPISTRISHFDSWGDGWMDLLPSIKATVLFGQGFGDLVRPKDARSMCVNWKAVPKQKNYMCASVSTLRMLYEKRLRRSTPNLQIGQLTGKIFWTSPCHPFDSCTCAQNQNSSEHDHCNPTQFLVSTKQAWKSKLMTKGSSPIEIATLIDTGAVVFANLGIFGRRLSSEGDANNNEELVSDSADHAAAQSISVGSSSAPVSTMSQSSNTTITNVTTPDTDSTPSPTIEAKSKGKSTIRKVVRSFRRTKGLR